MKIHEFQAKELFQKAGVTVLRHVVARSKEEAAEAYDKLGTAIAVVKAQ
ncbi:MAG: succinate--CoA ligase subunit beta, partial [Planctomycetaceae bacterium]|nr:succinate--CoA ligase subunit beta [Planctomycetaceae bacterium]